MKRAGWTIVIVMALIVGVLYVWGALLQLTGR